MKPTNRIRLARSSHSAAALPQKAATVTSVERLIRDQRGANLVEYIILVGVVALLALGAFKSFGGELKTKIGNQATTVQGINDTAEEGQP